MSARIVLVTGATGFLCSEVVRHLAARGDEVHALYRAGSDRNVLRNVNVRWHEADLTDPDSLASAARALARRAKELSLRWDLVHGGALISYKTRDLEKAIAINVDGTRAMLDAAAGHGVGRVVHISSVVTVATCGQNELTDESAAFNLVGCGVDYVTTKRAAEEIALARARDLDIVVVNPGAIFGAVERKSNTVRFIRRVAAGKSPFVAPPGTISVLGVEDAAAGVILALDLGRRGERYILVESSITSLALFQRIARRLGRRGPAWAVPSSLWPVLVWGARVFDFFVPIDVAPPQGLKMLGKHLRLDAAKARRELGWKPEPFETVLARTIEHLRSRGLIDGSTGT